MISTANAKRRKAEGQLKPPAAKRRLSLGMTTPGYPFEKIDVYSELSLDELLDTNVEKHLEPGGLIWAYEEFHVAYVDWWRRFRTLLLIENYRDYVGRHWERLRNVPNAHKIFSGIWEVNGLTSAGAHENVCDASTGEYKFLRTRELDGQAALTVAANKLDAITQLFQLSPRIKALLADVRDILVPERHRISFSPTGWGVVAVGGGGGGGCILSA